MTSFIMTADTERPTQTASEHPMPVSVQILSTLLFAGFAIPVTIVALNVFWPGGIALALILGWRGGFAPGRWTGASGGNIVETVKTLSPEAERRSSGNASFDAYRSDTLRRLEEEQHKFERFLGRLRDAKDQSEFDDFLDERAARSTPVSGDTDPDRQLPH